MKVKTLWNTAVLILASTGIWTLAQGCGPSIGSFCNKVCDCMGCSDSEQDDCVDSLEDTRKAAEDEGCGSEFNDYLSCSSSELECEDDVAIADGCDSEAQKLAECTKGAVIGGNPVEAYCAKVCDCQGCPDGELQTCVDSVAGLEQEAQDLGCEGELDALLGCLGSTAQCVDGSLTTEDCNPESIEFSDCYSGGSSGSGGGSSGSSGAGGGG
jgi:hypothetical protein